MMTYNLTLTNKEKAMLINNIQATILEQLAVYQYLSVSQLQVLTEKSLSYLREQLAILRQRKYIGSYTVTVTAKVRAESIYHLSPVGVDFLQNEKAFIGSINYPKSASVLIVKDYAHRLAFQWLQVYTRLYLEQEHIKLVDFTTYFDKSGNNRKDKNLEAKTKIILNKETGQFYIPDGIMLTEKDDKTTLYLIEHFADKNTIRIINTVATHARIIANGNASRQYNVQSNPVILCCFSHDSIKHAVIKRLIANDQFKPVSPLFFFASLDEVKENFGQAWHTVTNEKLMF